MAAAAAGTPAAKPGKIRVPQVESGFISVIPSAWRTCGDITALVLRNVTIRGVNEHCYMRVVLESPESEDGQDGAAAGESGGGVATRPVPASSSVSFSLVAGPKQRVTSWSRAPAAAVRDLARVRMRVEVAHLGPGATEMCFGQPLEPEGRDGAWATLATRVVDLRELVAVGFDPLDAQHGGLSHLALSNLPLNALFVRLVDGLYAPPEVADAMAAALGAPLPPQPAPPPGYVGVTEGAAAAALGAVPYGMMASWQSSGTDGSETGSPPLTPRGSVAPRLGEPGADPRMSLGPVDLRQMVDHFRHLINLERSIVEELSALEAMGEADGVAELAGGGDDGGGDGDHDGGDGDHDSVTAEECAALERAVQALEAEVVAEEAALAEEEAEVARRARLAAAGARELRGLREQVWAAERTSAAAARQRRTWWSLLSARQMALVSEVRDLYPIEEKESGYSLFTIRGIVLNERDITKQPEECVSTVLGYACHVVELLSRYLGLPVRFLPLYSGSMSYMRDATLPGLAVRDYPLFLRGSGRAAGDFHVAHRMLLRDVEELLRLHDMEVPPGGSVLAGLKRFIDGFLQPAFANDFGPALSGPGSASASVDARNDAREA